MVDVVHPPYCWEGISVATPKRHNLFCGRGPEHSALQGRAGEQAGRRLIVKLAGIPRQSSQLGVDIKSPEPSSHLLWIDPAHGQKESNRGA